MPKKIYALCFSDFSALLFETRYNDMPIKIYSIAHATGNNQLGGEKGGLFISEYIFILFFVIRADIPPITSGIAILIKNFFKLNFKIKFNTP